MKEEWNPNDFQGRSKDHVQRNYRIFAFLLGLTWFIGTFILIYAIIKSIFE